jgi:hypothetical protein
LSIDAFTIDMVADRPARASTGFGPAPIYDPATRGLDR